MKSAFYLAVAVVSSVSASQAFAADSQQLYQNDPNYFTIGRVTVQEVQPTTSVLGGPVVIVLPAPKPDKPSEGTKPSDPPSGVPEVDDAQVVLSKIINMGKQIWDIIKANKPVVNVQTDAASALPAGVNGWENLATWQMPQAHEYRVQFENLYGMSVIDFTFRVLYTHGGSFHGRGAYLTNATILPAHLSVAWGYTFNAQSTVASVMNAGTDQSPVAAMQLQLHWSIDTVMKHEQSTENFYIKGDGFFKALGSSGT